MPRYIDADVLIRETQRVFCEGCNNYNGIRCRACGTDDAISMLDNAPTVDVVPIMSSSIIGLPNSKRNTRGATMTIGEAIKKARKDKGYSRGQLSIKSGVPTTTITSWEKYEVYPTIFSLMCVADALNVSLDELVGRTTPKQKF